MDRRGLDRPGAAAGRGGALLERPRSSVADTCALSAGRRLDALCQLCAAVSGKQRPVDQRGHNRRVALPLNWTTNIAEIIGDERISQVYSWAGSLLLSWLIWYQLPANDVSLVWGLLGLALFLIGEWKSWSFLRVQSYVALTCSFAHIFYANFNVLSGAGRRTSRNRYRGPAGGNLFLYLLAASRKESHGLSTGEQDTR